MVRKGIMALVLGALVLPLAGCGVKSAPEHPKDAYYPRQYPYTGEKSKAPAPVSSPSAAPSNSSGQVREDKDVPRSPMGFPLEYPNRPSYN